MNKGFIAFTISMMLSTTVMADDSVDHASEASKHSALAGVGSLQATASVASAVVAVPVLLSGATIVAVGESGEAIHNSMEPANKPLKITDKVITADPAPVVVINQTIVNQEKH